MSQLIWTEISGIGDGIARFHVSLANRKCVVHLSEEIGEDKKTDEAKALAEHRILEFARRGEWPTIPIAVERTDIPAPGTGRR